MMFYLDKEHIVRRANYFKKMKFELNFLFILVFVTLTLEKKKEVTYFSYASINVW